jgi:hypothetical protein
MRPLWIVGALVLAAALPARGQQSFPPGDPVSLVLDDGGWESFGFIPSDVLIFNRFYPSEFPLQLTRVDVLFPPEGVEIGEPFYAFLYEDDDGIISNGTVYRATFSGTVQFIDGVTFTQVTFDPVVFEGPGQILVVIGQDAAPSLDHSEDHSDPQSESWVVDWDGAFPPAIPSTGLGFVNVNWMIRGFGTVLDVPVELQSVSVE